MSYVPDQPNIYQGKQVIINSDRLLFNAKTDSILLFSDKAIGFSTNGSFHFDTGKESESKFVVNTPSMYFGLDGEKFPTEPALLGLKTEAYLIELLDMIGGIVDALVTKYKLTSPETGAPCGPFGGNSGVSASTTTKIGKLKKDIKGIQSNRIYFANETK